MKNGDRSKVKKEEKAKEKAAKKEARSLAGAQLLACSE